MRNRQVLHLRVQPLDRDVEVPFKRSLDRVIQRQVEHALALGERCDSPCLDQASHIESCTLGVRPSGDAGE